MSKAKTPDTFVELDLLPENVISLSSYRRKNSMEDTQTVFYLNESEQWLETLESFPFLNLVSLKSQEEMDAKLSDGRPDLILLESGIEWAKPTVLIHYLHEMLNVPIVMIYEGTKGAKHSSLIKEAYAVGLYDVLFSPLRRDELVETLEVLLRLRIQVTNQH